MCKEILVIDIETTALRPQDGFIVEVGMVAVNLETGEKRIVFDSVCRENGMTARDREAWIFANSDLTVEEVRQAPFLHDLLPEIQCIVDAYPLGATAYNRDFDFGFLQSRGINFPARVACPMKLATPILKLPPRNRKYGDYKWPNVEESWRYFFPGTTYVEKHRGADDAMHEAAIIHRLYQLGEYRI